MFCSTVIPTVNRPTLSRAVHSILDQEFKDADFEVIVVNDSGQPLPDMDWQQSPRVRVITTHRRERSVARNAGAAIARGRYLHFLDDDDRMLPGAFQSFWKLAEVSQSPWLYGAHRLVDNAGNILEECHPDESGNCLIRFIAGEWLPIGTFLVEACAFFAVGAFDPLESLSEDVDLSRRLSLNMDIVGTSELVADICVGVQESTTDYTGLQRKNRRLREKVLSGPGAFARLRASAVTRTADVGYWHGRIVWTYLASALWNLRRRRLLTAVSRGVHGVASFAMAARHTLAANFWRGATRPHLTRGFLCREGTKEA